MGAPEALPTVIVNGNNQKKSEYNRRFGEPVPAFVITFVVALLTIALRTVVAEADGFACLYKAATPATCGEAIEVPLSVAVAVLELNQAERMPEPGAKISRHVPKFEKDERASVLVVEPVVIAFAARAGEELHAFALLLPAATATATPALLKLFTAVSTALEAPPPKLMFATAGAMKFCRTQSTPAITPEFDPEPLQSSTRTPLGSELLATP